MAEPKKEVLVTFRKRRRPESFKESSCLEEEKGSLRDAIKTVFQDVLQDVENKNMVLLVKSERWQGEFVELHGSMRVDHNSVVQWSLDAPKKVGLAKLMTLYNYIAREA